MEGLSRECCTSPTLFSIRHLKVSLRLYHEGSHCATAMRRTSFVCLPLVGNGTIKNDNMASILCTTKAIHGMRLMMSKSMMLFGRHCFIFLVCRRRGSISNSNVTPIDGL